MYRLAPFLLLISLLVPLGVVRQTHAAQIDPAVRDRVASAAVQVAIPVLWTDGEITFDFPIPVGSGTIISADGLVVTNQHVIDASAHDEILRSWETAIRRDFPELSLTPAGTGFTLLVSDGQRPAAPMYSAVVEIEDADLDIAILRITAYAEGGREAERVLSTPFVALQTTNSVGLGDRIHIFAFPAIGGDSLTYTSGAVSGFQFDDADEPRWITTDAVISGGSSGGTAINDIGQLIGVVTAGSSLDCRPGDTNQDGVVDANDVGCIPTGGSLGRLVPAALVNDLLASSSATTRDANTDRAASAQFPGAPTAPAASQPGRTVDVLDASFGFVDEFDIAPSWAPVDDGSHSVTVQDGVLTLTVVEPGTIYSFSDDTGSESRNVEYRASIASSSGWGDIVIGVDTEDGAEWLFGVNPGNQTWSLYRGSDEAGDFFYWVEPLDYSTRVSSAVSELALVIKDGQPAFYVNGVNMGAAYGIPLPEMSGNLEFRFGGGINPVGSPGGAGTLVIVFDSISLSE